MHKGLASLAAAVFLAVGLAGCSSGDSGGFSIKAPGTPGGEYVFTASGSADNYTWDLGDRLTILHGKTVRHAYDFTNGQITVVLTTKSGDKSEDFRKPLTLGTGTNAQPTFILEGQRNWTVIGESVKFSARSSTDPDGDPLRYTWSCVRTADAVRAPVHSHPGFGGVPFATAPAGSVTSTNALSELPAADRTVTGDLCETLGSGGRPSTDATIEGSFTKSGIYDVYLLASDPVHPTTSGKYHFVITPPEERPAALFQHTFSATFEGGNNGVLQESLGAQTGRVYDQVTHSFQLPLGGYGGYVTTAYNGTDATGTAVISWELKRGTVLILDGGADGENQTLPADAMQAASYTLTVKVQGPGEGYVINIGVPLDRDPFKVY
ncbi:MAG: hypothetical protein WC876_09720 [Candidatus Thermoplasmatota archaeon]|jgi:hypothetical protein